MFVEEWLKKDNSTAAYLYLPWMMQQVIIISTDVFPKQFPYIKQPACHDIRKSRSTQNRG